MKPISPNTHVTEPIALVGIGCRFPGEIYDTKSFWELLLSGKDGIVEIPPERWSLRRFYDPDPHKPGKIYVREGGFLQQRIDAFDAMFFGIAPREAECMDPQQRLLLETSWEALEDAGIPPDSLAGTNTGVFVGAFTLDHKLTQMGSSNRDLIGSHTAIGSTMTILSNRISYVLDLRGPSMSLDTACSSSLVAVHLACQSIWNGECNLAMAGGVNIMTRPEYPVAMCKGGFLAKDGRSKSFDARADGYGRGEGAGVVVLKPLSAALNDGDAIYALIRGTGVNQDGRTNGITVPNPESQAALISSVCSKYDVDPGEINYIEAHGTGTPVGDPLEAKALGSVIGARRKPAESCLVGSIKANIGHTEAAAGVAGLIKASLCLSHRLVPPQANLETPNPAIPFETLGLRLPEKPEQLAPGASKALACVNSFGYGGTNAHVILENAPAVVMPPRAECDGGKEYILPLSARSENALKDLARSWLHRLSQTTSESLEDLCYSAARRRSHHQHRIAVVGESVKEVHEQLELFLEQGTSEWLMSGKVQDNTQSRPVFVYTGMGPQWWAMGRELYYEEPVFRDEAIKCDAIFRRIAGWSILDEILADESVSHMTDTIIAQTSNFVIQAALTALWRSLGIEPAAIVGHSVGEVTAAYVAGVLGLEDAIKVSYYRSQIQKKASGKGKMLAVGVGFEQCANLLKLSNGQVSIAAINSPSTVTLAGDVASLEKIAAYLTSIGEFNRFLQVEVPYHSHFMEELKPQIREKLADLRPSRPTIALYSTVTGDIVQETTYDAEYWCNNIREPVYFAKALKSILRDGHRVFLEVGPHPVLSTAIKECCREQGIAPQTFTSMKRGLPERRTLNLALAGLYTAGCEINWQRLYSSNARYVKIPTYPWQREIYWYEEESSLYERTGLPEHPLLDHRLSDPYPTWQSRLNHQFLPYLNDHRVDGLVVLPAAAYVEAALAAHAQLSGDMTCSLENLSFHQALILESDNDPVIHVTLNPETGDYAFFSKEPANHFDWQLHATGKVRTLQNKSSSGESLDDISQRCTETVNLDELYANLGQRGLGYGPYFQTITQMQRGRAEVLSRIDLHQELREDYKSYYLHPTMLDGCFQSLIACLDNDEQFFMPVSIRKLTYFRQPTKLIWCHGMLNDVHSDGIEGQLSIYDENGHLCAVVEGLRCRALAAQQEKQTTQIAKLGYVWEWQQKDLQMEVPRKGTWLVFTCANEVSERLYQAMETGEVNRVIPVAPSYVYQQQQAVIQVLDQDQLARVRTLMQFAKDQGCVGIAYLWGLQAFLDQTDPIGIGQTCAALQITQLLSEVFNENPPRLYFVTQGAQSVVDKDAVEHLAQTPLVGFARVVLNEFPGFRCTLVDLNSGDIDKQTELLRVELLANDKEDDVAFRGSERYVHRLRHMDIDVAEGNASVNVSGSAVEAFSLDWINELVFREKYRTVPKNDEVEVELDHVNLTGLNRDLANSEKPLGYFATGIIRKVGESAKELQEGDHVIVVCRGLPATHCLVEAKQIFPLTQFGQLARSEIASLMTSVIPAYYSLSHILRVKPGETILIDADIGNCALSFHCVGLWLGAKPILYSSEDVRLQVLESLNGVTVIDARKVDLVQLISTGCNTLFEVRAWIHSSKANHSALKKLALQTNVHEIIIDEAGDGSNSIDVGLCGSYSYIDALALALSSPLLFSRILHEMGEYLRKIPLPTTSVHLLSGEKALELLTAPQTDSLLTPILSFENRANTPVLTAHSSLSLIDSAASYLITGGFGGFGLETANWLAKQGARYLVLVSRRGAVGEASEEALKKLRDKGVTVMAVAADISDAQQLSHLLSRIDHEMPPLKGVFHGAAVLDDAPIADLTPERIRTVMGAKAMGAWHLHRLTQNYSLDFFVLFSSVSALIGNGRQANYAAANTFLDSLSWHRKALGLPSTTVNWGAINTGMAVDSEEVKKHLAVMGMNTLSATQSLECWRFLHGKAPPQYGLMDVIWPRWQEFEPVGGNSLRFLHLMNTPVTSQSSAINIYFKEIGMLPLSEQIASVENLLCELVAKTLRLHTSRIDSQISLAKMGIDSLMAAELQAEINQAFGVRLSTLELMRGQSLAHLARLLLDKAGLSAASITNEEQEKESSELIDRLSEQDIDILLDQLLAEEERLNA